MLHDGQRFALDNRHPAEQLRVETGGERRLLPEDNLVDRDGVVGIFQAEDNRPALQGDTSVIVDRPACWRLCVPQAWRIPA